MSDHPTLSVQGGQTQITASAGDFRVVCFGGSAGGLKAYVDILHVLPADTGMAFVIAPHRAPSHSHLLVQILSGATKMPVVDAKEGMKLATNSVFIAPPRSTRVAKDHQRVSLFLGRVRGKPGGGGHSVRPGRRWQCSSQDD